MPTPAYWEQDYFRFRDDDDTEAAATWRELLNTDTTYVDADLDVNNRLRIGVNETGGNAGKNEIVQWQYKLNTGSWTNITTITSVVKAIASAHFDQLDNCTQQVSSGTFDTTNDCMSETGVAGSTNLDPAANGSVESELCFQVVAADVVDTDYIDLRIGLNGDLDVYNEVPRITISKADTTEYQAVGGGSVAIVGSLVKKGFKAVGGYAMTIAGTLAKWKQAYKAVGGYAMTIAGTLTIYSGWLVEDIELALSGFTQAVGGGAMAIAGGLARLLTAYRAVGGHAMTIAGSLARILTAYKAVGSGAVAITGVLSAGKVAYQAVGAYAMTIAGTLVRVFTAGQAVGGHSMVITGALGRVATFYRAVGGYAMTIVQALSKKGFKNTGGHAMTIAGVASGVKLAVQAVGGYAMTIAGSLVKKAFKDTGGHSMVITGVLARVATFYRAVGGYAIAITQALGTSFTPGGAPTLERLKKWLTHKVSN